ncbi:hypothetical protein SAMN05660337_2191 [Maridesulfovibrio ferrireducens]|uniref:Uncharacterized protein n=1 Tax=Maridesulfovibrio ferrireducens TaxID=246191 RepID=A0A1G9HJ30_9BACT|nr:hypothetical protein [Maridesulfovibrio ferrireducens]SDL13000.1 hypothetical protein SAMN05660337_2191 [Maridesulfovibrio ferrireducens]
MATISKMPGHMCRFYKKGKCLYDELLNPGYNAELRCKILVGLEDEYDKLLRQAEAFKLSAEVVSELWDLRIAEHRASTGGCHKNTMQGEDTYPLCSDGYEDICLLEFPRCEGICDKFMPTED